MRNLSDAYLSIRWKHVATIAGVEVTNCFSPKTIVSTYKNTRSQSSGFLDPNKRLSGTLKISFNINYTLTLKSPN